MFKSFRLQLTAWYVLFFSLLLAGFSGFLYFLLERHLYEQVDASLVSTAETVATILEDEMVESGGKTDLAAREIVREVQVPTAYLALFEDGQPLARSPQLRNLKLPLEAGIATLKNFGAHGARTIAVPSRRPYLGKPTAFTLVVVQPLDGVAAQLDALRHVYYAALPVAMLVAALGGFLLASKSIAPVLSISEQAEAITDKNLHTRLEAPGARLEFARLARVFNELLARLDRSFERMRDFMADASHELRTPIAIIRGEADVALAHNRQAEEYRESLAIIQDESRRLTRLVDDLLNLARADAGHQQLKVEEVYLNDLLEQCCRPAQAQARQKGVHLAAPPAGDIGFRGDPGLLQRLISNLLDNAIRYTPAGGSVEARLEARGAQAWLTIRDTGVGIPPELLARIFERFYRVDKARSRADGGFGLGLSIVKWIAEAHRGEVRVESRVNEGTTFTVVLPLADDVQNRSVAPVTLHDVAGTQ